MLCPLCASPSTKTLATRTPSGKRPQRVDLVGVNVTRREILCRNCGHRFWTIEMLEQDFDKLPKPEAMEGVKEDLRPPDPTDEPD